MLVLTRKSGERILIEIPPSEGPVIVSVEVIGHHKQTAASATETRLGFVAPKQVKIWREELGGLDR